MEEQRPRDGSPLIISSLRDSYPPICAIQSSGLFEPLGLADGGAGFLEQYVQPLESWQLQMDQRQQKIRIPSNMPMEFLTKLLLTSGLFEPLGLMDSDDMLCSFIIKRKGRPRILTDVSWDYVGCLSV